MNRIMQRRLYIIVLMLIFLLSGGCGPRYLARPPSEFDIFVKEVAIPVSSVQIAEVTERFTAPKQICTTFTHIRLFGTNESYRAVIDGFEQELRDRDINYTKAPENAKLITFFLSEFATVDIANVSQNDPVASLRFDQKMLDNNREMFETLFTFHVSHSYGNCASNPFWFK